MAKKVRLKDYKKMSMNNKKQEFLRPDFIYIPLITHTNTNVLLLVNIGDKVLKGTTIAQRTSDSFPIISTVSGTVTDIKDMLYLNGHMVKTVIIKNDFKEKATKANTKVEDISKLTKEEFINRLKKHGVSGLSGNDFSTYIKYSTDDKLRILLVNGTECEPYITSDYAMMKNYSEEILETVDAIATIMNLDRTVISFKSEWKELKDIFDSISGTYPNIDIITVGDYYPVGWEKRLVKDVLHLNYEHRPSEASVVVNNVSTIYEIYQALKFDKPLTEKYITITGSMVKSPQNIWVKIGSNVDEVINFIGGIKEGKKNILIANGPMMGKSLKTSDTMVCKPLTGVVVEKQLEVIETPCMRCGKCVEVCPTKLSPVLISSNIKRKEVLKGLKCEKCIQCGLCSYVCPAKINVREKVMMAKSEVLK